jgi:putative NADH-flavin reductase
VPRCLIIGCGCRGRLLAAALLRRGHAVRATTRDPDRVEAIALTGAEPVVGDPDRVATLTPALEHVGVAYVLLGSAVGGSAQLGALHGSRLEMLLRKMIDTTVRGIVYEGRGSVDPVLLRAGRELVRRSCEESLIPYVLLDADPGDPIAWLNAATAAADRVLYRA